MNFSCCGVKAEMRKEKEIAAQEGKCLRESQEYRFAFRQIVIMAFCILMVFILILLVLFAGKMEYSYKHSFLLGNGVLLCGVMLVAGMGTAGLRKCSTLREMMEKHSGRGIRILTVLFIFIQIYICYNAYFYTGWDVSVLLSEAFRVAEDQPLTALEYFSSYPNNLLLLRIFSLIRKLDLCVGVLDVQQGIMGILCVQCLLSGLTGYFLFQILRKYTVVGAWAGWFCYLVLVGTSGWILIPYSDSWGLIFPAAILYLYVKLQNGKHTGVKWGLLGALSCFGYHIKPQISIVFIAVVMVELFRRKPKRQVYRWGVWYVLAGIFLSSVLYGWLVGDLTKQLDGEKAFEMSHYVMMGLNQQNNGGYLEADVEFSRSFPVREERVKANLEVAGQRLKDIGVPGFGRHLVRKLMTNYGDGTFGWRNEGTFFSYVYELKNKRVSPALRNIIWGDGLANAVNETLKQGLWLWVLMASLGLAGCRKTADAPLLAVSLAVIGSVLFGLLFEARARYVYLYVPFYIAAAVPGFRKMMKSLHLPVIRSALHWGKSAPSAHPESENPERH